MMGFGRVPQFQGWAIMDLSKLGSSHPGSLGICSMMGNQNGVRPKQVSKSHSLASKIGSKVSLQPQMIQCKEDQTFIW